MVLDNGTPPRPGGPHNLSLIEHPRKDRNAAACLLFRSLLSCDPGFRLKDHYNALLAPILNILFLSVIPSYIRLSVAIPGYFPWGVHRANTRFIDLGE